MKKHLFWALLCGYLDVGIATTDHCTGFNHVSRATSVHMAVEEQEARVIIYPTPIYSIASVRVLTLNVPLGAML